MERGSAAGAVIVMAAVVMVTVDGKEMWDQGEREKEKQAREGAGEGAGRKKVREKMPERKGREEERRMSDGRENPGSGRVIGKMEVGAGWTTVMV